MINLILCGGSGTRLWPVSRSLMPKQFAPLFDGQSLFRKTVVTNSAVCESQFIVSNADQFFLAKDQLETEGMTGSKFLLEPVGRNTAPAIALACLTMNPETVVLVSPSDHVIRKKDEYKKVLLRAEELAKAGNLVTFGITPTSPETGYGYIEADGENVKRFVEKPDRATAEKYLLAGNFYWNSGIFCFTAKTFLAELGKYSPEMLAAAKKALANATVEDGEPIRIDRDDMMAIPSNSIDYAVMEKSPRIYVIAEDLAWSDLGSWGSVKTHLPQDPDGNSVVGGDVRLFDCQDCFVHTASEKAVVVEGLEGYIVAESRDRLLICRLSQEQRIKEFSA